ncbi:MAG TPA: DHA2 family efflux MFS transporter permease subunit [Candidatus Dormibacteraeota bacterium]|nr:DHA2 family efflux MFS transporter permease subunit [Candidatus Dormibacteraeota bacterium]
MSPRRFLTREPPPIASIAKSAPYPWFVVGTVCIGAFMGQLDASIAQLVLPTLQSTFHASLAFVSWVALAYLLVLGVTLPIFGRLADMFGRKLLYTAGFLVFILGSGLCGFADNLAGLIAARVLQAVGAGLLQANSVAIVTAAAGPQRRGRAIGLQGAAQAIGLSTGPALGGFLIQSLGWKWIFWINVPAGLIGTILGWMILPQTEGIRHDERFDWWGALLLTPALTGLLLALSEVRDWGVTSVAFLTSTAVAVGFFVPFVMHESRSSKPLVDLQLFRVRAFTAGNIAGLISYSLLFGVFFLLPFGLERGYGESPFVAGLRLTTIPIALGIVAPFAGLLSDRLSVRPLTVAGLLLVAASLVAVALLLDGRTVTLAPLTVALTVFGIGQGLFTAPNNSAIMGSAAHHRLGAAGGILNLMRTMGTSLGVALAATLLSFDIARRMAPGETAKASQAALLAGIHDVILLFAALSVVGAAVSMVRQRKTARVEAHEPLIGI